MGAPFPSPPESATMRLTSNSALTTAFERGFTLGEIPGILWTPESHRPR